MAPTGPSFGSGDTQEGLPYGVALAGLRCGPTGRARTLNALTQRAPSTSCGSATNHGVFVASCSSFCGFRPAISLSTPLPRRRTKEVQVKGGPGLPRCGGIVQRRTSDQPGLTLGEECGGWPCSPLSSSAVVFPSSLRGFRLLQVQPSGSGSPAALRYRSLPVRGLAHILVAKLPTG